jgi:uncharacterized damage-inducible protein DinB
MTDAQRVDPPYVADERPTLIAWLEFHRATLLTKCEGLTDEQLRTRSCEPSGLSLHGVVRHMAEVERNWFRRGLAREDIAPIYDYEGDPDRDFHIADGESFADDVARYQEECDRARAIAHGLDSLDVTFEHRRHGPVSARWVLVHMIEEYARHNGHADFLRERIDGVTGD